jgi:ABC-type glutathione transport system ATPase component
MDEARVLLEAEGLGKTFRASKRREFVAVDDVSFSVVRGRSLGIVGESGSGKTTVARMIIGLERPTSGRIVACGNDRSRPARRVKERRRRGREVQIVFQDPYSSLDPSQQVDACLEEVLRLHFKLTRTALHSRVAELLDLVGLSGQQGRALPGALSGGQRQRAAIARALAAEPSVLVLDEAVAALDVSIQAQVLNSLADIRDETGMTYLFISHDLAVVRQLTEELIVMDKGRVVERGETALVLDGPATEYTRELRNSIPRPGWTPTRRSPSQVAAG